jgi:hypothetical protein
VKSIKPDGMCDYCWRPARARIVLRQNPVRIVLGLPVRDRRVCTDHLGRDKRRG